MTIDGKEKLRIINIKRTEVQRLNGEPLCPCIGYIERPLLNELQQRTIYNIIRNDISFRYVIGRYPDGHIPELKLFIQFDEDWHKYTKENDDNCTLELASLGYIVFRISEKQWKENQDKVIADFQNLIKELNV